MRSLLPSVLGITALLVPSVWIGIGCAAGETASSGSNSNSAGTGGTSTATATSSSSGGGGGTGGTGSTGSTGGTGGIGGAGGTGGTGGTGGAGGTGGSMCVPMPELCDGIDNDCNGQVDEDCGCKNGDTQTCFTGDPVTLGVGVCKGGTQTCDLMGTWGPCAGEVVASAEVCNGLDDDCNGAVDDGLGQTTCGLGACTVTVDNCVGGVDQQCTPGQSSAEKCNGVDDSCDGQVDEGCVCLDGTQQPCYTGSPSTLGVGECKGGVQICNGGVWGACQGEVLPAPEACNAKDDDCNGTIDDGLGTTSCGVGACKVTVQKCVGGLVQPCVEGSPTPETCNGVDDDCDGSVDDGLGTIQCGLGECFNVVPFCVNGQLNSCVPKPASAELCDGKDNNCDGVADDGDPGGGAACMTGNVGACAAGTAHCQSGSLSCVQNVQPGPEICDGVDNDCNGTTDEGNPGGDMPCMTGLLGVCAAGTTTCSGGAVLCVQNAQPSPESCDGLDDNCNGQADEGNPGGGLACDTGKLGVCKAGATACQNGVIACNQAVQPSPELCDGLDNNCNGQVDEGNPEAGGPCSTGSPGVCAAGTFQCQGGQLVCAQNTAASGEICDGQDNDCNGVVDNGNPGGGQSCSTGKLGVCNAGTTACSNGAVACNQNQQPSAETCDGLDNDCNGTTDEGNPGGGQPCSTGKPGICAAGTTACSNGTIVCVQNAQPFAELCDGLDNDCDGQVDEGNPGSGVNCNTGKPGICAAGTTACDGGAIVCNQNNQPATESCNGQDDDCDGVVDDGNPGGGQLCGTGLPGVCGAGTTACSNGSIVCNQTVLPSAEVCDGQDNDCNGFADDGNPGANQPCNTGKPGVCAAGTTACVSGTLQCNQTTPATTEVCDGFDNDCDGLTDEDFDFQTDPNNCGGCGTVCGSATGGLCCGGSARRATRTTAAPAASPAASGCS